ncbi:hypothetical protein GXP70_04410 [Paenibacillus lycopersici]|uniref:Uncharacterized protein n=1 Tax=Paenibacillus lycopersici TaxID=2704462 RepID=A0A6C0FQ74_9BACL|nr:hypothetical protein [Paenibacillus lycopersici]QHT59286.1 hypothetical protein GXP70_04410 [Paenibacillus lycopersici]
MAEEIRLKIKPDFLLLARERAALQFAALREFYEPYAPYTDEMTVRNKARNLKRLIPATTSRMQG